MIKNLIFKKPPSKKITFTKEFSRKSAANLLKSHNSTQKMPKNNNHPL